MLLKGTRCLAGAPGCTITCPETGLAVEAEAMVAENIEPPTRARVATGMIHLRAMCTPCTDFLLLRYFGRYSFLSLCDRSFTHMRVERNIRFRISKERVICLYGHGPP